MSRRSGRSRRRLVISLHGHLAPVAWAAAEARPGPAGRLRPGRRGRRFPGALSRDVAELRERGLLCGHVTAGPAYGGEHEAISLAGALDAAARRLGWEAIDRRPRPGHPRLGHPARPRRDGGARRRPRRARARPADAALPAPLELRPARRATAGSATTPPRCSSCCWRPVRVPVPEAELEGWPLLDDDAPEGGSAQAALDDLIETLHRPPRPRGRADRPRRLRGQRAAGADDGTLDRRGPAVLRRAARRRAGAGRRGRRGREERVERISSRTVYEGRIVEVRIDSFATATAEPAEREIVAHPGAVAIVAHDERVDLPGAPAARGGRRARAARAAGRQARRRGRDAARVRAPRARRGDRHAGPASGAS